MEKEYRYKISRQSWGKVMLWETVIQSPYSMEFTEEQARKQIRRELLRDKNGGDWLNWQSRDSGELRPGSLRT